MPEPAHYSLKSSPWSSHSILLSRLPAPGNGRRVLDLGCGNGYLAELLATRGYQVTGVERADCISREFPASVRLITADLEQPLPPLGEFDIILLADVLEHLRDPASLLARVRGNLARGGHILASLPNSGNIYFRLTVLSGRFPQEDKGLFDRTHVRFYTWDGWSDLLRSAGLELTTVLPTGIPVGLRYPDSAESLPVRAAETLCYHLARFRQQLFAYQFVVEAAWPGGSAV